MVDISHFTFHILHYSQALDFLYQQLPMYQRVGAAAFKKDLTNTWALCEHLGNPQQQLKTVHVAGTNGKGSSAHSLAAVLQSAGYRVGLYTSPHLRDFTERIRIDGQPIAPEVVTQFVQDHQHFLTQLQPSFFEMTVALAFNHFARERVDIAVIEVGLGGRLDSTNVITPEVSLITNIGYDHTDLLGDTLAAIAYEKAGIIKPQVPVVIGEEHPETLPIFRQIAEERHAPLWLANNYTVLNPQLKEVGWVMDIAHQQKLWLNDVTFSLRGIYQLKNIPGILQGLHCLTRCGWVIEPEHIRQGFAQVQTLTGLKGRWQTLREKPTVIADTGHNREALQDIVAQLATYPYQQLYMVLGFSKEKSLSHILPLLPKDAYYYFCQATVPRALAAPALAEQAHAAGLTGEVVENVQQAYQQALQRADENDLIFIGGSSFVVADLKNL